MPFEQDKSSAQLRYTFVPLPRWNHWGSLVNWERLFEDPTPRWSESLIRAHIEMVSQRERALREIVDADEFPRWVTLQEESQIQADHVRTQLEAIEYRQNARSLLRSLLASVIPEEIDGLANEQRRQLRTIELTVPCFSVYGKDFLPSEISECLDRVHDHVLRLQQEIKLAGIRKRRKSKKQRRLEEDKATAAEARGKRREHAETVRRKLPITKNCPYCDSLIGEAPHADHIYPVARGGQSTWVNMVYVCEDCNLKKEDMTLTQFIKEFGFSRTEIEARLTAMGKEF